MLSIQFQNQGVDALKSLLCPESSLGNLSQLTLLNTRNSKNKGSGRTTTHGYFSLLVTSEAGDSVVELLFGAYLDTKGRSQKQSATLLGLGDYELFAQGVFVDAGSLSASMPINENEYKEMVEKLLNHSSFTKVISEAISAKAANQLNLAA